MRNIHHKQQGVVLVIGLLMLLVITLVGVTAMSGTTVNERMTANSQFQSLSFQAAESAIHGVFNIPSLSPSVMTFPVRLVAAPVNYNVDIGSTPIAVMANADIQFCGELPASETGFCNGMVDPTCQMDQVFDVRGSGQVSTLGTQELHLRRGARLMGFISMPFNSAICVAVP